MINGIEILENSLLTVTKSRNRTWPERLFSLPWRPWRRIKSWQEPDPNVLKMKIPGITGIGLEREVLVAHPATAQRIRAAALDRQQSSTHIEK